MKILRIHPEKLFFQRFFSHSVTVIQPCHRSPAQVYNRKNPAVRPVHNFFQFVPIVDLLKFEVFHGSAGNNHSVITVAAEFVECFIKFQQMIAADMRARMSSGAHKINVKLKRRLGKKPQKLSFRLDFFRHQIQNYQPQRANLLFFCIFVFQRKNSFRTENFARGQSGRYFDRHKNYFNVPTRKVFDKCGNFQVFAGFLSDSRYTDVMQSHIPACLRTGFKAYLRHIQVYLRRADDRYANATAA